MAYWYIFYFKKIKITWWVLVFLRGKLIGSMFTRECRYVLFIELAVSVFCTCCLTGRIYCIPSVGKSCMDTICFIFLWIYLLCSSFPLSSDSAVCSSSHVVPLSWLMWPETKYQIDKPFDHHDQSPNIKYMVLLRYWHQ